MRSFVILLCMVGYLKADGCYPGCIIQECVADEIIVNNQEFKPEVEGGWIYVDKFEADTGSENDILIVEPLEESGFQWFLTVDDLDEALFVVKQGHPNNGGGWVSYLFNDLTCITGTFYTENHFGNNDYSHVTVYTKDTPEAPELDAASSTLAIALFASVIGFFRERFSS